MISFNQYIQRLDEGFSSFKYEIPKEKPQLLFDFYMLSGLPVWKLTDKVRNAEELRIIFDETFDTLLDYLRPHQLKCVFFAICAEFQYIFLSNKSSELKNWSEKNRVFGFIKNYIQRYKMEKGSSGICIPLYGSYIEHYKFSYNAVKSTGIIDRKFIKLAKKAFEDLSLPELYGGKAWVSICEGWLRLDDAKSKNDIIVAIDHIFDLQHNTDTVFNKIKEYSGANNSYKWIGEALEKKKHAESLFEFYNDVSPDLKYFAAHVIKVTTGETLQEFMKNRKIKRFLKNENWYGGTWEDGIFDGLNWIQGVWKKGTWVDGTWWDGIWESGTWKNGTWKDGTWKNGTWKNGSLEGGTWEYGTWKNGSFACGIWKNGSWEGGTWECGTWEDGTWEDGTWRDGTWKDGTWENGTWKDGTWENGTFKNGTWEAWGYGTWKDGTFKNGTWKDGKWKNGTWENGTWMIGWIYDPKKRGNFEDNWEWRVDYVRSPVNPSEYFS